MSVASSEYSQNNPLSTITNQFTSQMNATPGGTKKNKINRKRGFNELDLPFDDNPPSKKHRLNSKQANTSMINDKENKENKENNENIQKKPSLFKKETTLVTSMGNRNNLQCETAGKSVPISKKNFAREANVESKEISGESKGKIKKANSMELECDEEEEEEEDIDIDIDMAIMNKNKNTNGGDYMQCDDDINCAEKSKSALGKKAKNVHDYSPKYRRSGLMFLVQCGIGFNKSK